MYTQNQELITQGEVFDLDSSEQLVFTRLEDKKSDQLINDSKHYIHHGYVTHSSKYGYKFSIQEK